LGIEDVLNDGVFKDCIQWFGYFMDTFIRERAKEDRQTDKMHAVCNLSLKLFIDVWQL